MEVWLSSSNNFSHNYYLDETLSQADIMLLRYFPESTQRKNIIECHSNSPLTPYYLVTLRKSLKFPVSSSLKGSG